MFCLVPCRFEAPTAWTTEAPVNAESFEDLPADSHWAAPTLETFTNIQCLTVAGTCGTLISSFIMLYSTIKCSNFRFVSLYGSHSHCPGYMQVWSWSRIRAMKYIEIQIFGDFEWQTNHDSQDIYRMHCIWSDIWRERQRERDTDINIYPSIHLSIYLSNFLSI